MPELITICLTEQQEQQLEHLRDTDKRPYMRERAAAVLKIAEGISPRQVAFFCCFDTFGMGVKPTKRIRQG